VRVVEVGAELERTGERRKGWECWGEGCLGAQRGLVGTGGVTKGVEGADASRL
jgi:hypothetical protein